MMALMLHLGGVGECVRLIWEWSVHNQESGDLHIQPLKYASGWAAISASKPFMEQMVGSIQKPLNLALSQVLVPRPLQPHLQQPISRLLSLTKPTVSHPTRVRKKAMMNPLQGHHPCRLLVMKEIKPANRPAADSPLQLPPCHH
jgi:hypothetical protein